MGDMLANLLAHVYSEGEYFKSAQVLVLYANISVHVRVYYIVLGCVRKMSFVYINTFTSIAKTDVSQETLYC